ncbi:MAG: universal stress protein [Phycisphaeraceae bacterium]|nr:universal stress protein [Phycisphaeraceae bacterium]
MSERVPFPRIMVCVTESPFLAEVVTGALRLATACGTDVLFMHAGTEGGEALRRSVTGTVDASGTSIPTGFVSRSGRPDRAILSAAREHGVDLIFAGALPRDPMVRHVLGSVARRLARMADRSVWLSIHRFPQDVLIRRLVCAIDPAGTPPAFLDDLLCLARRSGVSEVHLVHEYDPHALGLRRVGGASASVREDAEREHAASLRLELSNLLEGVPIGDLDIRTKCLAGRDGRETVEYAETVQADLLAVPGPARRITLLDRFFGHPLETLLDRFPCSLLVHRERPGASQGDAAP